VKVIIISIRRWTPLLVVCLLLLGNSYPLDTYVDERTHTEICFSFQDQIFPEHWYSGKIKAEAEPLSRFEKLRIINILDKAFQKYPDPVIRENLDRVYALRTMHFYGVPFGGTNNAKTVYLCDEENNPSFTNAYIEGVFHHEFSSVLKRMYPGFFNAREWKASNPSWFTYGNGGVDAIMNGEASLELDPDYFSLGFLTCYSRASLEEDMNVFAQYLFTGGPAFWEVVDQHSRIRKKARLLITFYQKIDPLFDEYYFRHLTRGQERRLVKNEK
jgi:hypothetical protein